LARIGDRSTVIVVNEAKVKVSKVVIHRAASRDSTDHLKPFLFSETKIDFLKNILMSTNNHRRSIGIHDDIRSAWRKLSQTELLYRQIDTGVGFVSIVDQINHVIKIVRNKNVGVKSTFPVV
jgi:hypothetical protein